MKSCHIVLPCYNENAALIMLLKEIRQVVAQMPVRFHVVVVDDASSDNTVQLLSASRAELETPQFSLYIITLALNQGHQHAIYTGLHYSLDAQAEKVIVMDSDGEDDPAVIPELYNQAQDAKIVLVKRGKRREKLSFLIGYSFYKLLFKLLTGARINFGNFSIVDRSVLQLIMEQNRFIHYASMLSKLKTQKSRITSNRRKRIDGKSKMSYSNLILHGIRSFVEYAEELLLTVLKFFVLTMTVLTVSIGWVLYQKLFTDKAIPGWAGVLSMILLTAAIISLGFFVTGIFLLKISNNQKAGSLKYEVK
jgi:glycosyltransferase involved in cell wall biosynthesis